MVSERSSCHRISPLPPPPTPDRPAEEEDSADAAHGRHTTSPPPFVEGYGM